MSSKNTSTKSSASPTSPTELKSLQRLWYAKLKATGFEDIEKFDDCGNARHYLQAPPAEGAVYRSRSKNEIAAQEAHYAQASEWLHVATFLSEKEEATWAAYCDGLTMRETAKLLHSSAPTVFRLLQRLQVRFRIWCVEQRHICMKRGTDE